LDLAVKHVSEVLESSLLVSGVLACFFFALDDLKSLKKLVLHLEDLFVALEVLESNIVVLLE
jgi:iron only hydrogenase large subunit-like protein